MTAITGIALGPSRAVITWADGTDTAFPYMWLRDNCACPACGPHTGTNRLQALLDIPDDVAPAKARIEGSALEVVWGPDGHRSSYDAAWLRSCARGRAEGRPQPAPWDGRLSPLPAVDYARLAEERFDLYRNVAEFGFCVVTGVGTDPGEIERLAGIGFVRETNFGRVFDLLAHPAEHPVVPEVLLPHTDEVYRSVPTGINIFHCLQPSADGGGATTLVDGRHIARLLAAADPEGYALLTRLPIHHERRLEGLVLCSDHPAFTLDRVGRVSEVRLNERTMTAIAGTADEIECAYRALRLAFRLAYDPANVVVHALRAGEAIVFDNLRVLHGRTAFRHDRHIRQCQVMRDEFYAAWQYLADAAEG